MNTYLKIALSILMVLIGVGCGEAAEKKKGGSSSGAINNLGGGNSGGGNRDPSTNPGVNNTPTDNPAYPFNNAPQDALQNIESISYKCFFPGNENAHRIRLFAGGELGIDDFDGAQGIGNWERVGNNISFFIPDLGFSETTTSLAIELDIVATLVFPSTICGALRVNTQPDETSKVLFCDGHEYIPQVLIENSEFYFWNSGYVKRRRWEKLLAVPDEIYSVRDGIWKEVNGTIYVVFPTESGTDSDSIRYLTMLPKVDGLLVKEFGIPTACTWE